MNKIGHIYKTTNLLNGKIYVGKHIGHPEDSYLGSGLHIKRAIKRYGKNNFRKEIIVYCDDVDKLNEFEKQSIALYRSIFGNKNVYNLDEGGKGNHYNLTTKGLRWKNTEEVRANMKAAAKNRKKAVHKIDCLCMICKAVKRLPHKDDCKCASCLSKRGEKICSAYCQCVSCKSHRGERLGCAPHKVNCPCIACKAKRKEHKIDCSCCSCVSHRNKKELIYV